MFFGCSPCCGGGVCDCVHPDDWPEKLYLTAQQSVWTLIIRPGYSPSAECDAAAQTQIEIQNGKTYELTRGTAQTDNTHGKGFLYVGQQTDGITPYGYVYCHFASFEFSGINFYPDCQNSMPDVRQTSSNIKFSKATSGPNALGVLCAALNKFGFVAGDITSAGASTQGGLSYPSGQVAVYDAQSTDFTAWLSLTGNPLP